MKKIFLVLLVFISIVNVKAYTYSEWTTEYPEGVEEILIEREVRYKWYKEEITNIEYLPKEYFGDKLVDINDNKYSDWSEESLVKPKSLLEREVLSAAIPENFTYDDVDHVLLRDFTFYGDVYFSEVCVIDKTTNTKIDYTLESEYTDLYHTDFIHNNDLTDFNKVNIPMRMSLNLGRKYNVNNLKVIIYYKSYDEEGYKGFANMFAVSIYHGIFNKVIRLGACENKCVLNLEYDNTYDDNSNITVLYYIYRDKLYKTYNKEIVYLEEYIKESKGYIKVEGSEKTFYRYITDEYIYMNEKGILITDKNYCNKNFCYLIYVKKKK